jgi:hypothetical protein
MGSAGGPPALQGRVAHPPRPLLCPGKRGRAALLKLNGPAIPNSRAHRLRASPQIGGVAHSQQFGLIFARGWGPYADSRATWPSKGDVAMATEAQVELHQALEAHKFDLEITRGVSALDQESLDRLIEATQRLLEWLSQALGLQPAVFPAAQTPSP